MKNKFLNIKIIGLFVLIISLFAGIFLVFMMFKQKDENTATVQKEIRFEEKIYSRKIVLAPSPTLALSQTARSISPSSMLTPTIVITNKPVRTTLTPMPTSLTTTPQPTDVIVVYTRPTITSSFIVTPSPTQSLSAQNNPTPTSVPTITIPTLKVSVSPSQSLIAKNQTSPTVIQSRLIALPTAGQLDATIILGLVAGFIIFLSLVI